MTEAQREIQVLTHRIGALSREQRKRGQRNVNAALIAELKAERVAAMAHLGA